MTHQTSVLDRPAPGAIDETGTATLIHFPARSSTVFAEAELKAMRAALDALSARFGIAPDSKDYHAAAIAIVRIASTGDVDVARMTEIAAAQLGFSDYNQAAQA